MAEYPLQDQKVTAVLHEMTCKRVAKNICIRGGTVAVRAPTTQETERWMQGWEIFKQRTNPELVIVFGVHQRVRKKIGIQSCGRKLQAGQNKSKHMGSRIVVENQDNTMTEPRICPLCDADITEKKRGRPRQFCLNACWQRACRTRHGPGWYGRRGMEYRNTLEGVTKNRGQGKL